MKLTNSAGYSDRESSIIFPCPLALICQVPVKTLNYQCSWINIEAAVEKQKLEYHYSSAIAEMALAK